MKDNTDTVIVLQQGKRLGYREYDDPEGQPLLYCHGFPGSRLEAEFANPMLRCNRVCLTTVERPGYDLSESLPGRRLLDWPDDFRALTSALHLEKFATLGVSIGSCYALACPGLCRSRLPGALSADGNRPGADRASSGHIPV